jgi:Xaa-Pro aminopeptidase
VSHASAFKRWWVDPRSSIAVIQALGRERVFLHRSVVQEMKEVKNKIEISGMREAHARDCGAAVPLRLLC